MILINASKTFSSLLFLIFLGCSTVQPLENHEWMAPSKPDFKSVDIEPINSTTTILRGYYLDSENASNLVYNIENIQAYIKKLELLVNKMAEYHRETIIKQGDH